jgi:hypothetical protein
MIDTSDPLAELDHQHLPEASYQPIARLLLVERLIGSRQASRLDHFSIGPAHQSQRQLAISYTDSRRYSNVQPGQRQIEGRRRR